LPDATKGVHADRIAGGHRQYSLTDPLPDWPDWMIGLPD